GRSGIGSADGVGDEAQFNSPQGIAMDGAGNLFVADTQNSTIRKITPAGVVSTCAGAAGDVGFNDAPGVHAQFNNPHGLAFDSAGNLYVADSGNQEIRKITPDGL